VSAVVSTLFYPAVTFLMQLVFFTMFVGVAVYLASIGKANFRVVGLDNGVPPGCTGCDGFKVCLLMITAPDLLFTGASWVELLFLALAIF
jgi:hypothetical protein